MLPHGMPCGSVVSVGPMISQRGHRLRSRAALAAVARRALRRRCHGRLVDHAGSLRRSFSSSSSGSEAHANFLRGIMVCHALALTRASIERKTVFLNKMDCVGPWACPRSAQPRSRRNLILFHVTGKKHPKLPRFSTLFKGLAHLQREALPSPFMFSRSEGHRSPRLASRECWSERRCPLASTSRCTLICCGTLAVTRWPTKDVIPVVYKPTSAIDTSSTPCGTRSYRPIGSRVGGKTRISDRRPTGTMTHTQFRKAIDHL